MKAWCSLMLALLAAPHAFAMSADEERAERARIQAERAQVQAAFAQRERECRQRFVVTSCVDEARRDRRQALEGLRQQQELLDEAQRKQRAAERMDAIRAKVSGDDDKRREDAARERRQDRQRAQAPARASSDAQPAGPSGSVPIERASPRRTLADEQQHRDAYERRQREAEAHREAVQRRNAQRAASGKPPAKPLPVPGAASVPASAASR